MSTINVSKIISYQRYETVDTNCYFEELQNDPLYILYDVATRTIRDEDRITPKLIIVETTNCLINLLETNKKIDGQEKRRLINAFLKIYKGATEQAAKLGHEGTLYEISNRLSLLHNYFATNHYEYYILYEFDSMMEAIYKSCISSNMESLIRICFNNIVEIQKYHWTYNIPSESKIWLLHQGEKWEDTEQDTELSLQWEHFSTSYINILVSMIETSLEAKNSHASSIGLRYLENLIHSTLKIDNLGELQRRFIINWGYYYMETITSRCANENLMDKSFFFHFEPFTIDDFLKADKDYSKIPLVSFGKSLIELCKNRVLSKFVLNGLGTLGRGCARKLFESNIYTESIAFICKIFDRIRVLTNNVEDVYNRNIYIESYDQVSSILKWLEKYLKEHENYKDIYRKSIEEVNKALIKYDRREDCVTLADNERIEWPDI